MQAWPAAFAQREVKLILLGRAAVTVIPREELKSIYDRKYKFIWNFMKEQAELMHR